jgi:hypothetical protein
LKYKPQRFTISTAKSAKEKYKNADKKLGIISAVLVGFASYNITLKILPNNSMFFLNILESDNCCHFYQRQPPLVDTSILLALTKVGERDGRVVAQPAG